MRSAIRGNVEVREVGWPRMASPTEWEWLGESGRVLPSFPVRVQESEGRVSSDPKEKCSWEARGRARKAMNL